MSLDCFKYLKNKTLRDAYKKQMKEGMSDKEIRDMGTKISVEHFNSLDAKMTKIRNGLGNTRIKAKKVTFTPVELTRVKAEVKAKKVVVEEAVPQTPQELARETIHTNNSKINDAKKPYQKRAVVQKIYKDYVKKLIKSDMMPQFAKKELNSVLQGMEKSIGKISLVKQMNRVNNIMYDIVAKDVEAKVDKVLKRKVKQKSSGRVKGSTLDFTEANILSDTKTGVQVFKDGLKSQSTKDAKDEYTGNYLRATQNTLDAMEVGSPEYISTKLAYEYARAKGAETAQQRSEGLDIVLSELTSLVETGRSKLQEKVKVSKEARESNKQQGRDETTGVKEVGERTPSEIKNQTLNAMQIIRKYTFNVLHGRNVGDLKSMFRIISKKGNEDADGGYFNELYSRLIRAATDKTYRQREKLENISETYSKIYKNKRIGDRTMIQRITLPVTRNGKAFDGEFTRGQLIKLWMDYQNPSNLKHYEKTEYTPEFMQKVDDALTTNDKAYTEALFEYYDNYYEDINNVYEKMYFFPMGRQTNYAGKVPIDVTKQQGLRQDINLLDSRYVAGSTAGGSTKARTNRAGDIRLMSANDAVLEYTAEMEHFINFAEVHQEYNDVLSDGTVKNNITVNDPSVARSMLNILEYYREKDMLRGGYDRVALQVLNKVAGNIIRSTLGLKPKIGLTQTISFFNGITALPNESQYWSAGMNPQNLKEVWSNSKYLKNRRDRGRILELITGLTDSELGSPQTASAATAKEMWVQYEKLLNYTMLFVKAGDIVGIMGAMPSYGAWKAKLIDQGMSPEAAGEQAMLRFEAGVDATQQTQTSFGKSFVQRSALGRFFTMYLTAPIQNYRNTIHAFTELKRGLRRGKGAMKGSVGQNVARIMNYGVAQPMLYTWMANLFVGSIWRYFDDEEELKPTEADKTIMSALILRNSNSIPIMGSMMQLVLDTYALEKEHSFGSILSNPLFHEATKITELIGRQKSAKTQKTKDDLKAEIIQRSLGVLAGTPFKQVSDIEDTYASGFAKEVTKIIYGGDSKEFEKQRKDYLKWMKIKDSSDAAEEAGYITGYPEVIIKQRRKIRKTGERREKRQRVKDSLSGKGK